jgi:thiol reductant ABC exporter CydC subunit
VTATLAALWRLTSPPRPRMALSVVLGALTVLFGVGLMATAGYLISRAAERPAVLSLMVTIVAVRVFGLGRPVIRYAERLFSHDLALRVLTQVRTRFYARIEPLAPAQIAAYRKGDLLSRMVADIDGLQNLSLRSVGPALVALLAGAVSVGVAAAFLPSAALVLTAGLLIGGLLVPALSGFASHSAGRRQAAARGELSAQLVELVGGAPEIVAFGAEPGAIAQIKRADRTLVSLARRDALSTGAADGLGLMVMGLTTAGVLALAIGSAHSGHLDRVLIAMLALFVIASFEAVTPLAAAARELSRTVAAGRRVLELTDRSAEVRDPASPVAAPAWPFAVTLEGVRARYPGQPRPALDGFSLTLAPGEHVALLGPSGVGKTTVVNLLLRFLDPEQGRVAFAGRDLRDYRQDDIRRLIAVAGQESHLFTTSIRANVALARPQASEAEIEQALRRARIWDWIMGLPDGLDTLVGEQGRELSGGQRQRIVLARALLADRPVLVFDEPTAHLDPKTARELMLDTFAAAGGRTLLLITHRSEGLELVDRVVTLEEGAS